MQKVSRSPWVALFVIVILSGVAVVAKQGTGLPAGAQLHVRLLDELDTGKTQAGQAFTATVAQPVRANGRTLFASGTKVRGRVVDVVSSGRLKRPASLTLELTQAGRIPVTTELLRIDGKSHLLRNVAIIGGESAAGAIIGGATGGKKGAAIGAAIGAGAGTATAYMTGKKEIVLPVETALTFVVAGKDGTKPATTGDHSKPGTLQTSSQYPADNGRHAEARVPSFSDHDVELILRYFTAHRGNLPPGLAKRGGHLPPGLERHLVRNGTLPPGLQKRVEPLPYELEAQLPRLPVGYVRVILAGRVLIVSSRNKIADLMLIRRM